MSAHVLKLVPKQVSENRNESLSYVALAELLHLVDQAQIAVNECWDRVLMTAGDNGEPDQMAVLDYEMALSDLLEAKEKAGL